MNIGTLRQQCSRVGFGLHISLKSLTCSVFDTAAYGGNLVAGDGLKNFRYLFDVENALHRTFCSTHVRALAFSLDRLVLVEI